jgi:N-dimethylarginine dimethylaminohydrolase
MCPPDHYTVAYAINPWMDENVTVDRELAADQWLALRSAIEKAGGAVEIIEQAEDLPDMVFTANLGVVANGIFVPARMRHPERRAEPGHAAAWAARRGLLVQPSATGTFEGMGDALPYKGSLIAGQGPRSTTGAWQALAAATGWDVRTVELPDARFYHIDLVFCPLDGDHALVAPLGLTDEGLATIKEVVRQPILLGAEDALAFSANSIVVGDTIIMPACSDPLRERLAQLGLSVVVVDVGEFTKAGGAVRCLTLPLDTTLPVALQRSA